MGFLDDQVNPIFLPIYKRSTTVWGIWDHADICQQMDYKFTFIAQSKQNLPLRKKKTKQKHNVKLLETFFITKMKNHINVISSSDI